MTEGIWIAIIGLFQVVLVALIGKISVDAHRSKKATQAVQADTTIVKREVKNSHSTNLREDLDRQHDELMAELRGVRKDVGRLDTRDIARGEEIRSLTKKLDKHLDWSAEWSADIEDTLNPRKDSP